MTVLDIQRRIMVDHYDRSMVIPNFTPPAWFECDVCEITKAGYMVEYEIKMSRADFKADAEKRRNPIYYWDGHHLAVPEVQHTKWKRLASGDPFGPVRFYFVTPVGLLHLGDIPLWAGWIEAVGIQGGRIPWKVKLELKKEPRKLHQIRMDEGRCQAMNRTFYWRFIRLLLYGKLESEKTSTTLLTTA